MGGKTESDMGKNPHAEERADSNEKREGGFKWSGVHHAYAVRCVSCMVGIAAASHAHTM